MKFGWRPDLEDFSRVAHLERPFDERLYAVAAESKPLVDPQTWMKVDDQGHQSSCVGHSGTAAAEILNHYATGQAVSFSRMYAYLTAQQHSGTFGSDSGATISGAIEAYSQTGFCKEELFPYPSDYTTQIPEAAKQAGPKCLLKSYTEQFTSVEDMEAYCASKFGVIYVGVMIPNAFMNCNGRVTLQHVKGRSVGGHAMVLIFVNGEWIDINSWLGWGIKGFAKMDRDAVVYWVEYFGNEIRGVSNIDRLDDAPVGRLDYTRAFG